jgi:hypothetical protein
VNDDETTSLANGISDLSKRHRVDRAQVDQLDGGGGVRRAEVLRKELNEARGRVLQELDGAD